MSEGRERESLPPEREGRIEALVYRAS